MARRHNHMRNLVRAQDGQGKEELGRTGTSGILHKNMVTNSDKSRHPREGNQGEKPQRSATRNRRRTGRLLWIRLGSLLQQPRIQYILKRLLLSPRQPSLDFYKNLYKPSRLRTSLCLRRSRMSSTRPRSLSNHRLPPNRCVKRGTSWKRNANNCNKHR